MAIERGYVYVLTNPSMPGLVKVGKTTTTPSQRMSELHATGVPTPFVLEFSVETPDCHQGERSVHDALSSHRVAANREFFRVTPRHAIEHVLAIVPDCKIVDFSNAHGVEAIERKVREAQEAARLEANEHAQRAASERLAQEQVKRSKVGALNSSLAHLYAKRSALGSRPAAPDLGGLTLLAFCFLPVPFGWLIWIGALSLFSNSDNVLGWVCVALIFAGVIANAAVNEKRGEHERLDAPFVKIEEAISDVQRDLKALGAPATLSSTVEIPIAPLAPRNSQDTLALVKTQTPARSSAPNGLTVTCPTCRRSVPRKPGQVDFKCQHCGGAFRY